MCLVKKYRFPKLALKPKIVYKVLYNNVSENTLATPFMDCKVKLGEEIKASDSLVRGILNRRYINGEGVHAFIYLSTAEIERCTIELTTRKDAVIVKSVIPRFTFYWESRDNIEIAARKMKITEIKEKI